MDKRSAGAGLAVLAIALMLIGVFTNSWWKLERGWMWSGVGLLEQKVCVDPANAVEQCRGVKHAEYRQAFLEMSKNWGTINARLKKMLDTPRMKRVGNRAQLQAALTRLDEMVGDKNAIDITVGDGSWITMGKSVYYGTFLALILLAIAVALSRTDHDRAPLMDKIAAVSCLALLTVSAAFVFRVPDYIKESVPAYSAGYSRWLFWLGAAAGTAAGVMLAMSVSESAGELAGMRGTARAGPAADGPTCPQCGARPIYREDVGCYICEKCRINV